MAWESEFAPGGAVLQPLISWQPPLMYNLTAPARIQGEESDVLGLFDATVTDETIRSTCRPLFAGGHYAVAAEKACICLETAVKELSGMDDRYGADLMQHVFRMESPVLRFNDLRSKSEKSEQQGYMHLYTGVMAGIRNPRAREPTFMDSPCTALRLIGFVDYLIGRLAEARYCPN